MEENNNIVQPVQQPQAPTIPANYKPISAWGYVGYELLFCIPIVGFIFMLVWAFSNGNINRKNFARSYLIYLIFGIVISAITIILMFVLGAGLSSFSSYNFKY